MNTMAIISIIFGVIIFGSRIPFIFSAEGAASFYENLMGSDAFRRVASILIFIIAYVMIRSAGDSDLFAADFISIFGWFLIIAAGIGVFGNFLAAPIAREGAVSMIGSMSDGLFVSLGIAVGAFFIGLGIGMM